MAGMTMEGITDGVIRPPRIAYYIYKIPNSKNKKMTIEQILDSAIFSEPTFNFNRKDFGVRYMHQGILAGDFFLALLSSSYIKMKLLRQVRSN